MNILTYMLVAGLGSLLFATTARGDTFADFRTEVQRKIPAGWVCSEIRTFEDRTLFDISSQANQFSIVITRLELLLQEEWTSRSERMKKAIDSITTDEKPEKAAATALLNGLDLPDGRYSGVAMSIDRSEPDIWYPEIGTDDDKSKALLKSILSLVDLYDKSEQDGAKNK